LIPLALIVTNINYNSRFKIFKHKAVFSTIKKPGRMRGENQLTGFMPEHLPVLFN
jgi:hypothetical protein